MMSLFGNLCLNDIFFFVFLKNSLITHTYSIHHTHKAEAERRLDFSVFQKLATAAFPLLLHCITLCLHAAHAEDLQCSKHNWEDVCFDKGPPAASLSPRNNAIT